MYLYTLPSSVFFSLKTPSLPTSSVCATYLLSPRPSLIPSSCNSVICCGQPTASPDSSSPTYSATSQLCSYCQLPSHTRQQLYHRIHSTICLDRPLDSLRPSRYLSVPDLCSSLVPSNVGTTTSRSPWFQSCGGYQTPEWLRGGKMQPGGRKSRRFRKDRCLFSVRVRQLM